MIDRLGHQVLYRLVLVQVACVDKHFAAGGLAYLIRRLLQVGLGAAADGDLGAFLGQHLCAGSSQPLACAAHDGDLVL